MNLTGTIQIIRSIKALPVLAIEERLIRSKNTEKERNMIRYDYVNVQSHQQILDIFKSCDSILMGLSEELNVFLINANVKMEGNPRFFTDHVHLTPEGSKFIAKYYFHFLKPLVKSIIKIRIE